MQVYLGSLFSCKRMNNIDGMFQREMDVVMTSDRKTTLGELLYWPKLERFFDVMSENDVVRTRSPTSLGPVFCA